MEEFVAKYKLNYEEIKKFPVPSIELERRAAYLELNTLHLENVSNITINSDGKKNGREEDLQEYCQTPYKQNEEIKGIIAHEKVDARNFKNQMRAKQLIQMRAIKLNKLRANRLHINIISKLNSTI